MVDVLHLGMATSDFDPRLLALQRRDRIGRADLIDHVAARASPGEVHHGDDDKTDQQQNPAQTYP